jgi:hypothetical protein
VRDAVSLSYKEKNGLMCSQEHRERNVFYIKEKEFPRGLFPKERDRETERQRDRETERQRDRETERQRDRETERQSGREIGRELYI